MGLGVIEIVEDCCNTSGCLKTRIISSDHVDALVGKYYKRNLKDPEWKVLQKGDSFKIGERIYLRSPMFCVSQGMKICQKCWGTKPSPTRYLGVLAGQILAERFTQLTMR